MDGKPVNPLIKHFRRPAIHIKLPSGGRYWPANAIDIPVTGEIPVYPMTNADEITLKTPDALMNGSGVVSVIQSCCPNITDAWNMPTVDVDALLIAIRIASYGQNLEVTSKCPKCGEEHDYEIGLSNLIDGVKCPDYDTTVDYDGLKIKLKPQPYIGVTRGSIAQFEEQRIAQALNDESISDDVRQAKLKESMKRLLDLSDRLLIDSTEYIETEDGSKVTDVGFITEFYRNAERGVTKALETRLREIADEGALPPNKLKCSSCTHEYEIPLEFDYSRFFG